MAIQKKKKKRKRQQLQKQKQEDQTLSNLISDSVIIA
jgi:hypothetical protein